MRNIVCFMLLVMISLTENICTGERGERVKDQWIHFSQEQKNYALHIINAFTNPHYETTYFGRTFVDKYERLNLECLICPETCTKNNTKQESELVIIWMENMLDVCRGVLFDFFAEEYKITRKYINRGFSRDNFKINDFNLILLTLNSRKKNIKLSQQFLENFLEKHYVNLIITQFFVDIFAQANITISASSGVDENWYIPVLHGLFKQILQGYLDKNINEPAFIRTELAFISIAKNFFQDCDIVDDEKNMIRGFMQQGTIFLYKYYYAYKKEKSQTKGLYSRFKDYFFLKEKTIQHFEAMTKQFGIFTPRFTSELQNIELGQISQIFFMMSVFIKWMFSLGIGIGITKFVISIFQKL